MKITMIGDFIHNYFGFNRQQRNGLFLLIVLSMLLLAIRLVYPAFIRPDTIIVKNLPMILEASDSLEQRSGRVQKREASPKTFFKFDPNTVTTAQLAELGFSPKTAATLLTFRDRGFSFRQKEDLLKVYGVSDQFYAQLQPYIEIKQVPPSSNQKPASERSQAMANHVQVKIELNTADSAALLQLKGIGTAYAGRIIKYRDILGGYAVKEQLMEVYGFNEELYTKIATHVTVDPSHVRKINLNADDFKTVNRHPYISYELTQNIFNYRRKHNITADNLAEVLKDASLLKKLLPYLAFE